MVSSAPELATDPAWPQGEKDSAGALLLLETVLWLSLEGLAVVRAVVAALEGLVRARAAEAPGRGFGRGDGHLGALGGVHRGAEAGLGGQGDLKTGFLGEDADGADVLLGDPAQAADQGDQPFGVGVLAAPDVGPEPSHLMRLEP